ncbi:MAG: hemolysin family protein [Rectinemataceae bacterium]|nr:hemolysin family protein [Rectinemataceae bacterium]
MIDGIEELSVTTVKEVMVPRTDTVFVPLSATHSEILDTVVSSGHSRIPVYNETIDDIAGILYAKDILRILIAGKKIELAGLVRKPYFVPETKRIDSLLREFRRRHVHIAIVVDEYGSVSGIVSLEDIIEEIVGEIQDEFDDEGEDIIRESDGGWICEARIDLDDLNKRLDLSLPEDDFDTLAGYVFDLFGRIPEPGESVRTGDLLFTIHTTEGHRITRVRILKKPVSE